MTGKIFISKDHSEIQEYVNRLLADYSALKRTSDVLEFKEGESIGVEGARTIKNFFILKPYIGTGKAVVIWEGEKISEIAQNALLKTFEELGSKEVVVIVAGDKNHFLPTFLSRLEFIYGKSYPQTGADLINVKRLASLSLEERFEYIEKSADRDKLFDMILAFAGSKIREGGEWVEFGKSALEAQKYKLANGNIRAILEWLILRLPKA